MYKVRNNFSPPHMNKNFEVRNEHTFNLRQNSLFFQPFVKSVYHWTECLSYLGPKVWDILPASYKNIDCLERFKKAIKNGNLKLVDSVKYTLQMSVNNA